MNRMNLQPLSLYAESIVGIKEIDKTIHIFNDTDNHLLRVTGVRTDKEKEIARKIISKCNKFNVPIHFE